MAYVYFMNNPMGKMVGDCVIRALSVILDMSWDDVYINLCSIGLQEADVPNANSVWGKYLRDLGFKRHTINDYCPDCYTVREFAYDHPFGKFVLCTGTHVIAVVNGDYFDTSDSGSEVPQYYYYKEAM